ncbi:MAG: glycosyltransferase [Betaproteobacteria bacterium]|nr:glycosyltransferase [Betaproteobacteria bacterium]NBS39720.1 glycosyltransferase [Betaproteobacteria bacterium]NBT05262.1 glycosyltransferase [Betaproteobacteria bacterium]NBT82082.1 glycosyltransferase [Betaproteobacteria bacterium]NCY07628.1 glycosyltransferase [Betaproteobacteria bacterium]
MRDRGWESELYPLRTLQLDQLGICLCIAPHPDDEILGCGGLLALLAQQSQSCGSLILTRGESASGDAASRIHESAQAAAILGMPPPTILDEGDRQLRYGELLISRVRKAIECHKVSTLLLPSLSEPHPDHQVTALVGLAAAAQVSMCSRILFYEVGAPMHPNCWIDIDSVSDRKWLAVTVFDSQLKLQAYLAMSKALAEVRAFGHRKIHANAGTESVRYAEAFFELDLRDYRMNGPLSALPQWPWVRMRQGLVNTPEDLSSVVVLIRSMDRSCIHECIASVFAQTHRPLEILIVNATGKVHNSLDQWKIRCLESLGGLNDRRDSLKVTVINPNGDHELSRSMAANALLDAAKARATYRYALFLDDDDLIDPNHIERMVAVLDLSSEAVAAYTGVRVLDGEGQTKATYDLPWSRERLMGINFLPIHAVLFRLDPVYNGNVAFSENLPVLEDWDFWLQMSRLGRFIQCPGVSASYRQALGQSHVADQDHPNYWKNWHRKLIGDLIQQSTADELANCLSWHALELEGNRLSTFDQKAVLDQAHQKIDSLKETLSGYVKKLDQMTSQLTESHVNQQLERSENERLRLEKQVQLLEQSNVYEAELRRVNAALYHEANEVVRLQAELQRISELAKTDYATASSLQRELEGLKSAIQLLDKRHAEAQAAISMVSLERDQAIATLTMVVNSRGWRLLQWLRRWFRP